MHLNKRKIIGLMATTAAIAAGPAAGSAMADFSVGGASAVEGQGVAFTVSATCQNVVFPCIREKFDYWVTSDGAGENSDYEPVSGSIYMSTLGPWASTSDTITVPTMDDNIDEPDEERFTLHVSHHKNMGDADREASGVIRDNDAEPTINSVTGPSTINEGTNESRSVPFVLHLSAPSEQSITRSYSTQDGTATAGSDYVRTAGDVTFAPGETTKTVNVPLITDSVFEDDEFFSLGTPSASQTTKIVNDDAKPGTGTPPPDNGGQNPPDNGNQQNPPNTNNQNPPANTGGQQQNSAPQVIYVPQAPAVRPSSTPTTRKAKAKTCKKGTVRKGKGAKAKCVKKKKKARR